MANNKPTILFVGGGSGGHIYPNAAVLERLEEFGIELDPRFVVSERDIDHTILKKLEVRGTAISAKPLSIRPRGLVRFVKAFRAAERETYDLIRSTGARAMLATGGFVSGPALKAAAKTGIPAGMINLDAVPGKANRATARYASDLFSAYDTGQLKHARHVGMPLRREVVGHVSPQQARLSIGLDPALDTLLIFGGSQGGGTINHAMADLVSRATVRDLFHGWQVLHLTGPADLKPVRAAYEKHGIAGRAEAYCAQMGRAWGAATLAVCRAGAGTVGESWANAVPCIYMPYPFHKDQHQRLNAAPVIAAGGGVIIKDRIDPHENVGELTGPLRDLMTNKLRREKMRQALEQTCPEDGATRLAEWLAQAIGAPVPPIRR